MAIRDIMTTDLVTVELGDSVQEAVEEMLQNQTGSVIVLSGGGPTGIITETDVLAAGCGIERPFADIPVSRAMSGNLVTISPDAEPEAAIEKMHEYDIKKLPVVDDVDLVGIVTMTDLVYHEYELVEQAKQLDRHREDDQEGLEEE